MADKRISALASVITPKINDFLPLVQDGETKKFFLSGLTSHISNKISLVGGTYSAGTITFVNNLGNAFMVNAIPQGRVSSIQNGNGISVDNINPSFPVISYTGMSTYVSGGTGIAVDNVNPLIPVISYTGSSFMTITKLVADNLIATNSLKVGDKYKITGVDVALFGGTDIILSAVATNKFSTKGVGLFYNARYNQNVAGYGIVVNTISYNVGDVVIWGNYHWRCNTVGVFNLIDILTLSSSFTKIPYDSIVYNLVYDDIDFDYNNNLIISRHDTRNDYLVVNTKYDNEVFIANNRSLRGIAVAQWGNQINYNTSKGTGNVRSINSYFESCNLMGFTNNIRQTENSMIYDVIQSSGATINNISQSLSSFISNLNQENSELSYVDQVVGLISNVSQINSITQNIFQKYGQISTLNQTDSTFKNINQLQSTISQISQIQSSNMSNIFQTQYSNMSNISQVLGCNIYSISQSQNSNINLVTTPPISNKTIANLTLENVNIVNNLSTATIIYQLQPKIAYTRPDGVKKIRYMNNSDVLAVNNITD